MPFDRDKELLEKSENRYQDAQDKFDKVEDLSQEGQCSLALDTLGKANKLMGKATAKASIARESKSQSTRETFMGVAGERKMAKRKERRATKKYRRKC